jgi:hypothetical protein
LVVLVAKSRRRVFGLEKGVRVVTQVDKLSLREAISQIRNELRMAVLESSDQDIVFTPKSVELELGLTFSAETEVGGAVKLLAFLDLSGKSKQSEGTQHKVKLTLDVADGHGNPIKVRARKVPRS